MSITTVYKEGSIEEDVACFVFMLKTNRTLLDLTCDMLLITNRSNGIQGNLYTKEEEEIIKNHIDDIVLEGDISEEEAEEFKKIYIKIGLDGSAKALEELIYELGPYYKTKYVQPIATREARILQATSNKNFDVIFCEKNKEKISKGCKIDIVNFGEFHECKRNVATFIPINENNISEDALGKLEFIEEVYGKHKEGDYFIPTFHTEVTPQKNFLINAYSGRFSFITILGKRELLNLYTN